MFKEGNAVNALFPVRPQFLHQCGQGIGVPVSLADDDQSGDFVDASEIASSAEPGAGGNGLADEADDFFDNFFAAFRGSGGRLHLPRDNIASIVYSHNRPVP